MKYSYFTVGLPEFTPAEAAALLAKHRYDGVEWRTTPQREAAAPSYWAGNRCTLDPAAVPGRAKEIRKLAKGAGLTMFGLGTYSGAHDLKAVERDMLAAVALGVPQVRVSPGPYDPKQDYARQFAAGRKRYAKVAKLAAKHKVRANVEIHPNSLVISAHSAVRLLEGLDPRRVGVIWDPGNTVTEGFEPPRIVVEVLGRYLAYVHVKNGRGAFEAVTPAGTAVWRTAWAPMPLGIINWEQTLAELIRAGYDGWLSFEDFSPPKTEDKVRENIRYLRACEKAARKQAARGK